MSYRPIEEYGIIGDLYSAALVGMDGSIDWLCLPRFDSPSVFAAILDDEKGGRFKISPTVEELSRKQLYWPDTKVLITRFFAPEGVAEITDYMPVGVSADDHRIIRRVKVVRGEMDFRMECSPAFDYARDDQETEISAEGARFRSEKLSLGLAADVPLRTEGDRAVAEFGLREDQMIVFALGEIEPGDGGDLSLLGRWEEELFLQTVDYWRRWLSRCTYAGRWREMFHRSALTLKLLTYEPTGAIVATLTTSLPEEIGGERNWDYRYDVQKSADGLMGEEGTFNLCTFWLVEALTRAGRLDEARLIFEQMLGYTNHLGLYAEEIGPSGEALGNFPQAFTHLTLISAAYNLDWALGKASL